MGREFIGSGWAFPARTDATGRVALTRETREIEESIHLILATAKGERPMRPEFGCGVHDYVFAPADATTAGAIAESVRVALEWWEPRIELADVVVRLDRAHEGVLLIEIHYTVRGTNDPRNLVFPFYTIPSEGSGAAATSPAADSADVRTTP